MSVTKDTRGRRVRWVVRWRQEGRNRSRAFDLKADAEAFEANARREAQRGAFGMAEPSTETLREWTRTWWDRSADDWARSTRVQRGYMLDRWVLPFVGDVRLRDLGYDRVAQWQVDLRGKGCSPHQRNQALRLLSACLGAAVKAGRLPINPCANARRTPQKASRPKALTPVEVERIRSHMPDERDRVMVSLMAYAGLRPEEVLALTWGNVAAGFITIDAAYTYRELKGTKTGAARHLDLVAPLAADLEAFRPHAARATDLVAANQGGGFLELNNWRGRVWARAAIAAGFSRVRVNKKGKEVLAADVAPYDLRHTFASLKIHEGTGALIVAHMMGHTSTKLIESTYGHMFAAARLTPNVLMVEAIEQARSRDDVRKLYVAADVRRLHTPATVAKNVAVSRG